MVIWSNNGYLKQVWLFEVTMVICDYNLYLWLLLIFEEKLLFEVTMVIWSNNGYLKQVWLFEVTMVIWG